jgi:hypothetical protein
MVIISHQSQKQETFLILVEPTSMTAFLRGTQFPTYSHDLNLLQLAEAAIKLGNNVRIGAYDSQKSQYDLISAWPATNINPVKLDLNKSDSPTFVISANHLAFTNFHREIKGTKNVLVQAAIHIFEQPNLFYPNGTASFINTFRNVVDFVITQNERMSDLLFSFLALTNGFRDRDRILISKLTPRTLNAAHFSPTKKQMIREELGITEDSLVILNAGGTWKWTQFNLFLKAFVKVQGEAPGNKLFLIQPALTQSENSEHYQYNQETFQILDSLNDSQRSRIYVGNSWKDAGEKMEDFLTISDYGLNINQDSLEHWQSYRVRTLEYISAGLPVIQSRGSFWDDHASQEAFIMTGHSQSEFESTLRNIVTLDSQDPRIFDRRSRAIRKIQSDLSLESQAIRVINELINHPGRFQKPHFGKAILWDFRFAGPRSTITLNRLASRLYFSILNNTLTHSILVALGVRKLVRSLRKITR